MEKVIFFDKDPQYNCTRVVTPGDKGSIDSILASLPDSAVDVRVIAAGDLPTDRTFRNAWKPDLTVDMDKAKGIWKDKMREVRAPKLVALDLEFMRAIESGDEKAKGEVMEKKKVLRDVTAHPDIDKAQTPDELKAVWPTELE